MRGSTATPSSRRSIGITGATARLGLLLAASGCGPGLLGTDGSGDGSAEGTASDEGRLSAEDGITTRADTTAGESTTAEGTTPTSTSGGADTTTGDPDTSTGEPALPVLALGFSPIKQFDFSWAPWPGATHYQLLERVTPDDDYVPLGGDLVETSASFTMPLHLRFGASYVLRACDATGCVESEPVEVVSSMAEAVGYVKASNTELGDNFGRSIALSGDGTTLAVGAPNEDGGSIGIGGDRSDDSASEAGAVYVFVRDEADHWSQQAYVKASNAAAHDSFGWSVALSDDGHTLAVGAPQEFSGATGIDGDQTDESAVAAGAVYVFVRDETDQWSQQAYVKASNTDAGDHFGWSLALSGDGDTLVVGADGEGGAAAGIDGDQDLDFMTNAGAVYVFVRNAASAWSQQAYVKPSNPSYANYFGDSLALSEDGDTLAVGATGAGNQAGAAYVFVRDASEDWSQQAYLEASNAAWYDRFGISVALSGDGSTLAVGANGEDSIATGIDGDQTDDSADEAGAVYVFVRDDVGSWTQQVYVKSSDPPCFRFGTSLALSSSGDLLAVGAEWEGSLAVGIGGNPHEPSGWAAGATYVLVRDAADEWSHRAYVKASNAGSEDHFGIGTSMSNDGSLLAIGAYWEDGGAIGIGGDPLDEAASNSGAIYLY